MDYWQELNWFAIQTKAHQENLAAAYVAKLDAEVFFPRIRQEQMICGIARLITKPLFPSYFFARFCPFISSEVVQYAHGVLRVVGTRRFPTCIDAAVISAIQDRIQDDGLIRISETTFQPGDKVAIKHGPLAGWMGRVERECCDSKRVSILLEAIEQARVLTERHWLEAVEPA